MKRLNFITQFKIEFLLLFTGCRKVPGKMPVMHVTCSNYGIVLHFALSSFVAFGKLPYPSVISISIRFHKPSHLLNYYS